MKKYLIILFFSFFISNLLFAKSQYFQEGLNLYKKKFDDAKFKFEQDILYNPKSELSYLYLSKIYITNKINKI